MILAVSLNIFGKEVSVKKAMLLSAIMPGLGQAYAHNYSRAGVFAAGEVAIRLSAERLKKETNWTIDAYEDYAYSIAGVSGSKDDAYYQLIQENFSSEIYNDSVERYARNVYLIINNDQQGYRDYLENNLISEENSWDWENRDNWNEYKDLRFTKQNYVVYENLAVAALIINRLISMVDAAITAKKANVGELEKDLGELQVAPDFTRNGLRILYEIKF